MIASDKAVQLITHFEGLKINAYLDGAGVPTIGFGHTKGVKMGQKITAEKAREYLVEDIEEVERGIKNLFDVRLHQYQFDALVSFAFNLGVAALKESTLRRMINEGKIQASNEFLRWVKIKNPDTGKYQDSAGLLRRRKAEKLLFDTGVVNFFE